MQEVLNYLKNCKTFFIATSEGDQPRVRPFGAVCEYDNKLYIITNNQKNVFKQMMANPKIELCGMENENNTWLRVACEVIRDDNLEAKKKMLEDNPELKPMYQADDGVMEVLYLKNGTGTISSFTAEPKTVTL